MLTPFRMTAKDIKGHDLDFYLSDSGRAWIRISCPDGTIVSTINHPKEAGQLAVGLLPVKFWPQFAAYLAPKSAQAVLF